MNLPAVDARPARRKILLLAPFLYGDKASHGGAVVCWAQLKELAQNAELAFVGFSGIDDAATEARYSASLKSCCTHVTLVPLRVKKTQILRARLNPFLLGYPELATFCDTPQMAQAVQEACRQFQPDLVWIQFPQMARYIKHCQGLPAVMDVQDAYTISAFRKAQGISNLRHWVDWLAWARYEARYYAQFKATLTLSEQDAQVLQAMNPLVHGLCMGLPLGQITPAARHCEPLRVGFVGNFGHQPNVQGVAWFLNEVWPQVLAQVPQARFVAAGGNPPTSLTAAGHPQVEFVGFVPDLAEFYAANTVTVVPLITGGGVKIKTVEALLVGCAVVATPIGIEGTQSVAGEHALVEHTPKGFALAIASVLQTPSLRQRLSTQALAHATPLFSNAAWRHRVLTLLDRITP